MAKRKVTMRVIQSTKTGEKDHVQEHILEALEGALRKRVFYVEIGNRPPGEAFRLLKTVQKHCKGTEIPEFGEDLFVPMIDGKPQCKIEFWEEDGAAEDPDRCQICGGYCNDGEEGGADKCRCPVAND